MKGNQKNILIGMIVVAVLIVLAAYKFFYSADVEKADQVQNDIKGLETRLSELTQKVANRMMYENGIEKSGKIIKEVLKLYGPGNTAEKTIMMIVDLCQRTGCTVSNMSFYDDTSVYESVKTDEEGNPDIQVFKGGVAVSLTSGYTQLKKIMDFINSYPERMNVENFSTKYDSKTGLLSTNMVINLYAAKDEDHVYVEPIVEDIELSTVNIFKTKEVGEEELPEGEIGENPTEQPTEE